MRKKTKKRKTVKVVIRRVYSYYAPRHKLRAQLRSVVGELNGLRKHHAETECKVERQAAKIASLQAEIADLRKKLAVPSVTPVQPAVKPVAQKTEGAQPGGAI